MLFAEYSITVSMIGAVLRHEKRVLHHAQEYLSRDHVRANVVTNLHDAAVIFHFHRMKPRLPSDELAGILQASAGICSATVAKLRVRMPKCLS